MTEGPDWDAFVRIAQDKMLVLGQANDIADWQRVRLPCPGMPVSIRQTGLSSLNPVLRGGYRHARPAPRRNALIIELRRP